MSQCVNSIKVFYTWNRKYQCAVHVRGLVLFHGTCFGYICVCVCECINCDIKLISQGGSSSTKFESHWNGTQKPKRPGLSLSPLSKLSLSETCWFIIPTHSYITGPGTILSALSKSASQGAHPFFSPTLYSTLRALHERPRKGTMRHERHLPRTGTTRSSTSTGVRDTQTHLGFLKP